MELLALVALGSLVGGAVLGGIAVSKMHSVANTAAAAATTAATNASTAVTNAIAKIPVQLPSVATVKSDVSADIAELKTMLNALLVKPPVVVAAAPLAPAPPTSTLAAPTSLSPAGSH